MTVHSRHRRRRLGLEPLEIRQMFSGNADEPPVVLWPVPASGLVSLAEARVTLGNLADGSTPEVRVNSGPWTALQPDAAGDVYLPRLRQGLRVRAGRGCGGRRRHYGQTRRSSAR